LLQILDRVSDHGQSEPFRTYEALEQAARSLKTYIQLTQDSVAGASREQHYMAARLYSDCEALHRAMYTELQQLVLGPQVVFYITTRLLSGYALDEQRTAFNMMNAGHLFSEIFVKNYMILWSRILKPAFMFNNYSGDKVPDEMFASTTEWPESHSVPCHTLLPCSDKRKETVNSSSARITDDALWDISANEAEGLVPSGSGEKWTQSVSNPSEEAAGVIDEHQHSELNTAEAKRGHQPLVGFVTKDMGQPVAGIAERELSQGALVQSEDTKFILEDNNAHNLERFGLIAVAVESRTAADNEEHRECNVDPKQLSCFDTQDTDIHRLNTDAQQLEEIRPVPKSADHPPLTPSFPRKRKYDVFQHQCVNPHLKSYKTICPPKWEPPCPSQRTVAEGVSELKKIRRQPSVSGCPESSEEQQTQIKITPCETQLMFKIHTESHVLKQTQPISLKKVEKSSNEMARIAPKQKPFAKLCKHRLAKLRVDSAMDGPKGFYEVVATSELQTQSKTGLQPAALASDARVKDSGKLNSEERVQMLEEVWQAEVVVVTMMFRDGTTQLDAEQVSGPEWYAH
ncbi:hypothetical protein GOODEAATRI_002658, partial [Goodea atripinnis]